MTRKKSPMRLKGIRRLLQLMQLLRRSRQRLTVVQLARALKVTPRTIWRDIDVLLGAKIPVKRVTRRGFPSEFWIAR